MNNAKIRIGKWDYLLIIGVAFAPMTGLRIWKIGPGELLCFIWCLRGQDLKNQIISPAFKFFCVFLCTLIIGSFICLMVSPTELSKDGLFVWMYIAVIVVSLYNKIITNDLEYNVVLFDRICTASLIWYVFLYIYSLRVSKYIWGAPLWYGTTRFSGGGINPHQVAVLMCGIAFWFLYRSVAVKNPIYICLFIGTLFILNKTQSSTGIVAIVLGLSAFVILFVLEAFKSAQAKKMIIFACFIMGILILIIFPARIYNALFEWVSEDPNGLSRFSIWSSFGKAFKKSPIFGLGPGIHALKSNGVLIEFHNSYLEIVAATGIVGAIAFVVFTVSIIKTIMNGNQMLLPIVISLYGYSLGGFACRRLVYWVIIIFTVVIAEQQMRDTDVQIK